MDMDMAVLCILLLVTLVSSQQTRDVKCFTFKGNSYLHFTPNNFNNHDNIHYTLKFKTTQANGILMYARGAAMGDDEALYLRDGKLTYSLFNSAPTGIGRQFGGFWQSEETVNNGEWVTAHVYRSWRGAEDQNRRRIRYKTGLALQLDGEDEVKEYVDYREREGITLDSTIYFGGYSESLSESVGYFDGMIKDIQEEKNNQHVFENPSLNYQSNVDLFCSGEDLRPN